MISELLTKGPPAALMIAAAAWGFYQVYRAIRENKSSSVVDVVSIAQVTQEQLNQERDRTNDLYRQVGQLSAENVRLHQEITDIRTTYEDKIAELRLEMYELRKQVGGVE